MITKTIRSRFHHEPGEIIEGCKILEKHVIAPPEPIEKRRGIYDYLVEVPPAKATPRVTRDAPPTRDSYTRTTPDEMGGGLIRRIPSR